MEPATVPPAVTKGLAMIRWSVLVAAVVAASAAAFVAGAAVPDKAAKLPAEAKSEVARPAVAVGQKTGYFNMAKVMRESRRAQTSVQRLNARRERLAANLVGLRNMHAALQAMSQTAADARRKEEIADDLIRLGRQVEDADRSLNKALNDRATFIIVELYDDIYATVEAVARENGLAAVLAYPDAVTREEKDSPQIKELKLKPPAAQPFYVDPSADYSDEIVRRLNERFKEEGGE
jgi:Skp family chaperone for outer membrane proteins